MEEQSPLLWRGLGGGHTGWRGRDRTRGRGRTHSEALGRSCRGVWVRALVGTVATGRERRGRMVLSRWLWGVRGGAAVKDRHPGWTRGSESGNAAGGRERKGCTR